MPKIRVKTDRIEVETEVNGGDYPSTHSRTIEIISAVSKAHQDITKSEFNENTK
jgi:hypothetical protein